MQPVRMDVVSKTATRRVPGRSAEALQVAVERFLKASQKPALEPGEEMIPHRWQFCNGGSQFLPDPASLSAPSGGVVGIVGSCPDRNDRLLAPTGPDLRAGACVPS